MQFERESRSGLERLEGPLKVTGRAQYTAETRVPGILQGVLVKSTVPNGAVEEITTTEAEAAEGCVAVITPKTFPKLRPVRVLLDPDDDGQMNVTGAGQQHMPLQDYEVHYRGQDVAVVLAETLEQAQWAASLVKVRYRRAPHEADFNARLPQQFSPGKAWTEDADTKRGDVEAGMRAGAVRIDRTYVTAVQHHVTMEPHATVASWDAGQVTIHEATTWVFGTKKTVAGWFGLKEEDVRVLQPFVGGSFGSKGPTWPHVAIAVGAAKVTGRPVRIVLSRPQTFTSNGYRPSIQHRLRLAATRDGFLTAVAHDAVAQTSRFDRRVVAPVTKTTKKLYACPNCETSYRLVQLNAPGPFTMRGPGETPGLFALESAMDELAYELGMDPIELRMRNDTVIDPETGKPWSSRGLKECLRAGADRFGWAHRNPKPAATWRNGRQVGMGVASMAYDAKMVAAKARVRVYDNGRVVVASSTCEPGTGATTMMVQIAAEVLGIGRDGIECEWGDTTLPMAPLAAGSQTTASVGSAVRAACLKLRHEQQEAAPLSAGSFREAVGSAEPDEEHKKHTCYSFGAHFAEVSVDPELGGIKLERYVAVFAAGRIVNAKTAQSQLLGGIIWGIGMALMEGTRMDVRQGAFVNDNLAEYHVPTNLDVPKIEAFFLPETDTAVNPLGVKGIGEIGTIGSAAAIANAVYHATGKRVRELPITLDRML